MRSEEELALYERHVAGATALRPLLDRVAAAADRATPGIVQSPVELVLLLKLLHVLSAMALVIGLVGRWIVNSRAEHSADLASMEALLGASTPFERMAIGSSFAVPVTGLLTAWYMRLPVLGAFEGSSTNWVLISLVLFFLVMGPVPPLVFLPAGRAFEAARAAAHRAGSKTAELQAAFANPRVRAAHIAEIVLVIVVIALMVLKPI